MHNKYKVSIYISSKVVCKQTDRINKNNVPIFDFRGIKRIKTGHEKKKKKNYT